MGVPLPQYSEQSIGLLSLAIELLGGLITFFRIGHECTILSCAIFDRGGEGPLCRERVHKEQSIVLPSLAIELLGGLNTLFRIGGECTMPFGAILDRVGAGPSRKDELHH